MKFAVFIIVAAMALILALTFWFARTMGSFAGWRKSAQCQRCGFIIHGWDTPVWSNDKTCEKCGPSSTWKTVFAKPVGLWGYDVKDGDQ